MERSGVLVPATNTRMSIFPDGLRQMLHILRVRGIRHSYRDIPLFLRQLLLKSLQAIFAARRGHHLRPLAREQHRRRTAYAAGSTDNQNCLILEWKLTCLSAEVLRSYGEKLLRCSLLQP